MDLHLESLYQERIMDHYRNPRHAAALSCAASCVSHGVNPTCGDRLVLSLQFDDDGMIKDVCQQAQGCAISVASASLLAEYLVGKSVEVAKQVNEEQIKEMLGVPISVNRMRCAMLSLATLRDAIAAMNKNI